MKLTPKEAYERMMNGEVCLGKRPHWVCGDRYRVHNHALENGGKDESWIWVKSDLARHCYLDMEWSTVDEPDINAAKLDHENAPGTHTIDCYPKAHIDELEERIRVLEGSYNYQREKIKKLEGLVSFGKFVLEHGYGYSKGNR